MLRTKTSLIIPFVSSWAPALQRRLGSGQVPSSRTILWEEMYREENFDNEPLEKWATATRLGIDGFDLARAEEFYHSCIRENSGNIPTAAMPSSKRKWEDANRAMVTPFLPGYLPRSRTR